MISETADILARLNFEKIGCQAPENSIDLRGNSALSFVRTETLGLV